MAAHSSVLPGESQGRGSLVGCHLWGRAESDTTEGTQQQQQRHCDFAIHFVKDLGLLETSVHQSHPPRPYRCCGLGAQSDSLQQYGL